MLKNQLRELREEELGNYEELGTATGTFGICLYMGHKYVPNFKNRVIGFRIEKNGTAEVVNNAFEKAGINKEKSISVTFYEEKEEESEITFINTLTHKDYSCEK